MLKELSKMEAHEELRRLLAENAMEDALKEINNALEGTIRVQREISSALERAKSAKRVSEMANVVDSLLIQIRQTPGLLNSWNLNCVMRRLDQNSGGEGK